MNQQFYIAVNGQQTGPFTYDELKAKGIQRDTLLWTEGLDSWTKAEHIALVKDILRATPPPLPNEEKKQQAPPPPPVPQQPTGKYFGYELAGAGQRLLARIVGSLIVLVPFVILFGDGLGNDRFTFNVVWIIVSVILALIFYPMWSGNLGHKIMGLKVISAVDGSDQRNAGVGALRELLNHIFGIVLIPVIWLLWDDDRQNLYDKVVKTLVVKKKQER